MEPGETAHKRNSLSMVAKPNMAALPTTTTSRKAGGGVLNGFQEPLSFRDEAVYDTDE